jgi:hypothetical protein
MKAFFLLLVIIIIAALVYKYVVANDIPMVLKQQIAAQVNPFTVPKDSEAVVWKRALQLLEGRKSLFAGGNLVQTDSTLFLPYYNEHQKGNSIIITRKRSTDSVIFIVNWWYSQKQQEQGAKEIALFMQKGIGRYKNF